LRIKISYGLNSGKAQNKFRKTPVYLVNPCKLNNKNKITDKTFIIPPKFFFYLTNKNLKSFNYLNVY